MTSLAFLLSKHPYGPQDGETVVSRLLLDAAAECFPTRAIALSAGPGPAGAVPVEAVPKPPLAPARVALGSLRRRRSAIHDRFAPPALVAAVGAATDDRLVARRLYMAEAALDAGRTGADAPDAVVDVLESEVLRRRGGSLGPLLALEAGRTAADEGRCLRAARSLACLADEERPVARAAVGRDVPRLDLALPPHGGGPSPAPRRPVAFYLGDRLNWAPNRAGLRRLYELWPRIRRAVPDAELVVAGLAARSEPAPPAGVRVTGFLPDLDAAWAAARVMLVPVPVGGGVRVKILEAASRGVPVVAGAAAVGSIADYLPVAPAVGDDAFVARASRLLGDRATAAAVAARLWEANARHGAAQRLEHSVEAWLNTPAPHADTAPEGTGVGARAALDPRRPLPT